MSRSAIGPFVGSRADVRIEDSWVRVVETRRLDASLEQRLRLPHEELVERILTGNHDRKTSLAASRATPLLPERGDRPRKADGDRAVEPADVDAELERVGRCDAEQLAVRQPSLDLATLSRRVTGAIGGQPRSGRGVDPVRSEAMNQLGRLPALREADRAQAAGDERGHEERGLGQRACPDTELRIEQRRIPEDDIPCGPCRRVRLDDRRRNAGQRESELGRVCDRGRRKEKLRLGAIQAREPTQAPDHVPDVRPEDAAVHVCLVDDDVAQVVEDVGPTVVVRQDADVQHVRIRQDHVRRVPDLPAAFRLRISVIDGRAYAR